MSLSGQAIVAAQRVSDPHGFLWLLTISGGGLTEPARVVNDTRDVISQGELFLALPFEVTLPKQAAKETPRAQLVMDNVGRELVYQLESLTPGVELLATLQCVYRETPDVVEMEFTAPMSGIRVTPLTASASIGPGDLLRRPTTNLRFDPFTSPGLFPN